MADIALVDDDKNILASVSMLLEQEGYHVRTFTDGASALTALSAAPPDLAILDIKMPRMDGLELLRRLRQNADLPVIFLTSKDEEIDELMGLNAGADDYIRKPFSQRLLLERVKAVLRRAEGRNGAAALVPLRAAQHGLDAFEQQPLRERLADVIVGTGAKPLKLVDFLVLRGEEDHRHVYRHAQPP